jgi:hypothetical protein
MASKGQNAQKEEWFPAEVRSNALGAFECTHGRTQEPRSHAAQGPSG